MKAIKIEGCSAILAAILVLDLYQGAMAQCNLSQATGKRGWTTVSGLSGGLLTKLSAFCPSGDGSAFGNTFTSTCGGKTDGSLWTQVSTMTPDNPPMTQFTYVSASPMYVQNGQSYTLTVGSATNAGGLFPALGQPYRGWVDAFIESSPAGNCLYNPGWGLANNNGQVQTPILQNLPYGQYVAVFRPAMDDAAWSVPITITVVSTTPPVVASINPPSNTFTSWPPVLASLQFTGSNFQSGATVQFIGAVTVTATNGVASGSGTILTFMNVQFNYSGTYLIQIINPDGSRNNPYNGPPVTPTFSVYQSPSLDAYMAPTISISSPIQPAFGIVGTAIDNYWVKQISYAISGTSASGLPIFQQGLATLSQVSYTTEVDWYIPFSPFASLPTGTYQVTATAQDGAGNTGSAGPVSFTVTNNKPILNTVSPSNVTISSWPPVIPAITIDGYNFQAGALVSFSNGVTLVASSAGVNATDTQLSLQNVRFDYPGTYSITVVNPNGSQNNPNVSPPVAPTLTVGISSSLDALSPPKISIVQPSSNQVLSSPATVTGTAIDNVGVAQINYVVTNAQGQTVTTGQVTNLIPTAYTTLLTWSVSLGLPNGVFTFTATAFDASGASSKASVSFSVNSSTPPSLPTVTISTPVPNTVLSNGAVIAAAVSGQAGISSAQAGLIDSQGRWVKTWNNSWPLASAQTQLTLQINWFWTAAEVSNGNYTLTFSAMDVNGNRSLSGPTNTFPIQVINSTATSGGPGPTVAILAPINNAVVSGTVTVNGTAGGSLPVANIGISIDSAPYTLATGTTSWIFTLNTVNMINGAHTVTAKATDSSGNTALASINVTVSSGSSGGGDTIPPTVSVVPLSAATVSGTVTLTALASDNVAVAWVQFKLDGNNLGGHLASAPYTLNWNTAQTSPGMHTLTATAADTSGNQATSAPITVTVVAPASADATPGLRKAYVYPSPAVAPADPTIRVLLGMVSSVEVTIFDVAGHVVNSGSISGAPTGIANGQYYYDYVWTGRKASGVYFAVIHGHAGDGSVIRTRVKFAVVE